MKRSQALDADLEGEFRAAAQRAGCELLRSDFKGGFLRLVIDRPQGVTLADCEAVSRQVSAVLDVLGFDPGRYTLEVSSPGLDRPLEGAADYQRFLGRLVRITWRDPGGARRTAVGRLESYREEGGGEISVLEDAKPPQRHELPLSVIEKARLEVEL